MSYSVQISFSGSLVDMNNRPKVDSALNEVFGEESLSSNKIEKIIEEFLETKSIINLESELDILRKMNNVNFDTMSETMLEELVFTLERLFLIKINLIEYVDNSSELMLAELMTENKVIENRYVRQNMKLKVIILFQGLIIFGLLVCGFMYMVSHRSQQLPIMENGQWTIPNTTDHPLSDILPSRLPTPPNGVKGPADVDLKDIKPAKPAGNPMPVNPVTEVKP